MQLVRLLLRELLAVMARSEWKGVDGLLQGVAVVFEAHSRGLMLHLLDILLQEVQQHQAHQHFYQRLATFFLSLLSRTSE